MSVFDKLFYIIAKKLFAYLKFDSEQIDNIAQERTTKRVYVLRRPSYLESALLKLLLIDQQLIQPDLVLKPLSRNVMRDGFRVAILSLRGRLGFETSLRRTKRYRKAVEEVIDECVKSSVEFIPVSFFAGRGPRPWPGRTLLPIDFSWMPLAELWLVWVFVFHRNSLSVEIGPIVSTTPNDNGVELLHRLSREVYRKEKRARGARTKDQQTIESIVLSGERFEKLLAELAESTSASREQLMNEARGRFREVAATMKGSVIYLLYLIVNPVIKSVFSSIEVRNLDKIGKIASQHPVVLVPSHRSHFDYILMSYVLYNERLPIPYVAAGINLNFWPFGDLARAAGAFFIRRTFGDDAIYKLVLDNYMSYLIKHGHMLEFFIEGGRSRSGGMRSPRLGLLKYLVRSWEDGGREDVQLVPVGITYERLAEEDALVSEQVGSSKKKENIIQLLKLHSIWRKRFGTAVVVVGEPLSLKDFKEKSREFHDDVAQRYRLNLFTEDLGFAISRSIRDSTALTGTALSAAAICSFNREDLDDLEVCERMILLLKTIFVSQGYLRAADWEANSRLTEQEVGEAEQVAGLFLGNTLKVSLVTNRLSAAMKEVLGKIISFGLVSIAESRVDTRLKINEKQYLKLAYYKNNVLHLFAEPIGLSFASLSEYNELFCERLHQFHQQFKTVFLFPYWRFWGDSVQQSASWFEAVNWLSVSKDFSLAPTADGHCVFTNEKSFLPKVLFQLVVPYYQAVFAALLTCKDIDFEAVTEEEFLSSMKVKLRESRVFPNEIEVEATTVTLVEFAINVLLSLQILRVERAMVGAKKKSLVRMIVKEREGVVQAEEFLSELRALFELVGKDSFSMQEYSVSGGEVSESSE